MRQMRSRWAKREGLRLESSNLDSLDFSAADGSTFSCILLYVTVRLCIYSASQYVQAHELDLCIPTWAESRPYLHNPTLYRANFLYIGFLGILLWDCLVCN